MAFFHCLNWVLNPIAAKLRRNSETRNPVCTHTSCKNSPYFTNASAPGWQSLNPDSANHQFCPFNCLTTPPEPVCSCTRIRWSHSYSITMTYQPDSVTDESSYYTARSQNSLFAAPDSDRNNPENFTPAGDADHHRPRNELNGSNNKGVDNADYETVPPLGVYLKDLSRVLWHAVVSYRTTFLKVFRSLALSFIQFPTLGVFFLVLGIFTFTPLLVFLGFSVISCATVLTGVLAFEGFLVISGMFVLLLSLPAAFVIGVAVAVAASAAWLSINALVNLLCGHGLIELIPLSYRKWEQQKESDETS